MTVLRGACSACCPPWLATQLRLTVSGSAACPQPIMARWEELSGAGGGSASSSSCTSLRCRRVHLAFRCKMACVLPMPLLPDLLCSHCHCSHAAGQRLLERYGMTETGMLLGNPYRGERRPGSVGLPFPGVDARLALADGSDAGEGALR